MAALAGDWASVAPNFMKEVTKEVNDVVTAQVPLPSRTLPPSPSLPVAASSLFLPSCNPSGASTCTRFGRFGRGNESFIPTPTLQFNMHREAAKNKDVGLFDELCAKYWVDGWQVIRPSGNPLTYETAKAMWTSADVKMIASELVSIDSTKVLAHRLSDASLFLTRFLLSVSHSALMRHRAPSSLHPERSTLHQIVAMGMAAVVVYTTHDQFEYKGTPNDDIAVFSVHPKP